MKNIEQTSKMSSKEFYRNLVREMFSTEIRNLFLLVNLFVIIGTIFYKSVEQWTWIDSFYFSVMTLTTVGYGDFAPETSAGKLFTTAFIFGGLGIVFTFLQTLAREQAKEPFFMRLFSKVNSRD